jgi:hypothetical protein
MNLFADLVSTQLRSYGQSHDATVSLTALLAVREAAASDPKGIFHSLTTFILRYAGRLGSDVELIRQALDWSEIHVDEAMGELAGYDGHGVEDDHAEQSLGSLLDNVHDDGDLLVALRAMNAINRHRISLWEGTVKVIEAQQDEKVQPIAISPEVYEHVRLERQTSPDPEGDVPGKVGFPARSARKRQPLTDVPPKLPGGGR